MTQARTPSRTEALAELAKAAADAGPVGGLTHDYYRYPARFSPQFVRTAISLFSQPGQLVLDPYMGGATTVVEAARLGRRAVGNDLNSLAVFVGRVKTTLLTDAECTALRAWAEQRVPRLSYRDPLTELVRHYEPCKMQNMTHVRARFIKKIVAGALASLTALPSPAACDFARCAILNAAQLALDGRSKRTTVAEFRRILTSLTGQMLAGMDEFKGAIAELPPLRVSLLNHSADKLSEADFFQNPAHRVSLVVTSPPYPGVHVLYHRWQVDGRRETSAPYWIAACNDGQGASFYNFGDRREKSLDTYFSSSLRTLRAIRGVMGNGGHMVQMVAFSDPALQLPRYVENMRLAGFRELVPETGRIWRDVPNRKWHATLNGKTHSSREVVLIHVAE